MLWNEYYSYCGRVAQLGEHLRCKQGVAGSNPATSTNLIRSRPETWVIHKANQPDIVVNFFDAHSLASKDRAEVDFFAA